VTDAPRRGPLTGLFEDPGWALRRLVGTAFRPRTYLRLFYLLLAFPLGSAYLVVLVAGAFTGASMAVIVVGLLVLLACLALAWVFAIFERELLIHLVGIDVPPLSLPQPGSPSAVRQLLQHLRRPNTWKSIVYLGLLGPFGSVAWVLGAILVVGPAFAFVSLLLRLVVDPPGLAMFYLELVALAPLAAVTIAGLNVLDLLARSWGAFGATMLGVSLDEQRAWEAERRAAAAERGRRELILAASHELRTPIASIQGHLDSLLLPAGERPPPQEWEPYVQVAAGEVRRLGRLVDELLMLARADANQLTVEMRAVEVWPLLESVTTALGPLARRERQITVVCRPTPPDLRAAADPNRLTQVLTNLVRNAVTHTQQGGAVAVQATDLGPDHLEITVSDTGVGIAPEDLPRVFERFYRSDGSRTRDSGGFGLGLAIAKDLVEAMGGTIGVTSEVGLGTTFRVTLRRPPAGGLPSPA
jgi:signal transduction histidine kinase